MNEATSSILVVDDDDDIRELIVLTLESAGYRAFGARHGREALEMLRDEKPLPRVIVLDLMMPVMDGATFRAEQLRDPRLSNIPVVLVTAHAKGVQIARELGLPLLKKPVPSEALIAAIRKYDY